MRGDDEPEKGFVLETTQDVRPRQRVDYWRSLHPSVSIDVPNGREYLKFKGERLHYRADNGGVVGYTDAEDTQADFQGADPDFLLLSVVLSGETRFRSERGKDVIARPGSGVLLVDSGARIASRSRNCSHAYLTLPKQFFEADFDPAALTGDDGICLLPEAGLLRFLRLQLQEIASSGRALSARAARVSVESALQLAVGALGEGVARPPAAPRGRALFEAAMAMINVRASDVGLTAESLARGLGCSRALLYRVFADRDRSVGQVIREARLSRAKSLLAGDASTPIKLIARWSGYENAAAFSRAFRLHTGLTPNDYRAALREALR